MTDPLSPDDLEPSTSAADRAALAAVAERLIAERPAPRAGFRAQLRARLGELEVGGLRRNRPRWLWHRVSILMVSGGGLLGLVGLGVGHIGPFAP